MVKIVFGVVIFNCIAVFGALMFIIHPWPIKGVKKVVIEQGSWHETDYMSSSSGSYDGNCGFVYKADSIMDEWAAGKFPGGGSTTYYPTREDAEKAVEYWCRP